MATKREWLAEKGLAKPGTRGKFSNDAKAALAKAEAEGVVFDEVGPVKVVPLDGDGNPKVRAPKRVQIQETMEFTPLVKGSIEKRPRLWAVGDGYLIAYKNCVDCKKPNMECKCDGGPQPPTGFVAADYDFA